MVSPAVKRNMLAAASRREELITYAAQTGGTVREICEGTGIPIATYQSYRQRHEDFGPRFDAARMNSRYAKKKFDGSFISFRRHYLGMETTWFQQKIVDAIEAARPGQVTLVLIPPGHGKTTLLEDWCTYKLCTNPSYRITAASETVDHGEKIVGRVRDRLEPEGPTPHIAKDFGPLAPEEGKAKDQVWGARRFNTAQKRLTDERDYSMSCVGIKGRVQGTRCDLLLLDDIQDVKSLDLSDTYYAIITQSFLSRPEMFGRTVIIGTRVGEFDVYRKLIDAEIPDRIIRIPAYDRHSSPVWPAPTEKPKEDDPSTWAPEGIKFLWPEKYDRFEENGARVPGLERFRYAVMRFMAKEQGWWRIYMQKPEAASSMTFDEETTKRMLDEHRSVAAQPRPISVREDPSLLNEDKKKRPVPIIIGVDPAVGGGNGVLACAMRPHSMEVLTAHLDYNLTKFSQIIDLIEEDCHRFTTEDSVVTTVVIEDKAFQKGLLEDDRMLELQKRFGFRIVPNTTGREKTDKDIGVPSMPMAMVRQEITIPWADSVSHKEMFHLLDQLHSWRPGVNGVKLPQDLVMCLWFCYRQWRSLRTQRAFQTMDTSTWKTSTSPLHRPMPRRRSRSPYRTQLRGR